MKAPTEQSPWGAALLVVLVLLSSITLLVVSLFALARQEAAIGQAQSMTVRAILAEEAAFVEASAMLRALTSNDQYLVTSTQLLRPGRPPCRYTFVSTADAASLVHVPLFAGGQTQHSPLPNLDLLPSSDLPEHSPISPQVIFAGKTRRDAISLPRLTHLRPKGTLEEEETQPELGFIDLPAPSSAPWRARYTYWIEDLEGYPNLDVVHACHGPHETAALRLGYRADDSRVRATTPLLLEKEEGVFYQFAPSHRGQSLVDQVAPGLSPREIALQAWSLPGVPRQRHPYHDAAHLARERHWVADARFPTVGAPWREPDRLVIGLHPYWVRPHIPYGHGYPDEGRPRHNLNVLVAKRDIGIADIVARNLPRFRERQGGFPPDEDYLATLAANVIDYADEDGHPALPGNTHNARGRQFRGVDAYGAVNEFYLQFKYLGYETEGENDRLHFEATPYAEFWNPTNQPVLMKGMRLKFRLLEPLRFQANSVWHVLDDSHRVLDEAASPPEGLQLEIPPNHYRVVRFGRIRWERTIPRPPLVAFPVIQELRGVSSASLRAHYAFFLGEDLVDHCGRPGPQDPPGSARHGFFFPPHAAVLVPGEYFMRLAIPNLSMEAYGGVPKVVGSHLGDPWMPWYSRGTAEDAQYRLKATPGFRNFDHDKASPAQPDRFKDQARVRDWPDRGYDSPLGSAAPHSDAELPEAFDPPFQPELEAYAPWRLSQLGHYHSVTELGHLHDPVMWAPLPEDPGIEFSLTRPATHRYEVLRNASLRRLPPNAVPHPLWGGGNTLRIGRPEHRLFDQPGRRASQWLDLFHTGYTGSNLRATGLPEDWLYHHHHPRDHQPPPAAPDPAEAESLPYRHLYPPELNAQGQFQLVHGQINLNTTPTRFEIETLLRGPSVSSDLRLRTEHYDSPDYAREGESGELRSALRTEAIPSLAEGLMRARPFLGPSHLARVFSELLEQHEALPEHHNDAEAEEPFARLFNLTTLSSRHFRIYTAAEIYHADSQQVLSRARRVREVFLRPIRHPSGDIERVQLEILSTRQL